MRIISQDRCTNVPYDAVVIKMQVGLLDEAGKLVISAWSLANEDTYRLGTYTTEEQAEDVMEDIAEDAYENSNPHNYYRMPPDRPSY